jgi:excisionase family DNA binding protein
MKFYDAEASMVVIHDKSSYPLEAEMLTAAEVSAYLRIHRATLYRLVRRNEIPFFKIGSDYRFSRKTIDHWRLNKG